MKIGTDLSRERRSNWKLPVTPAKLASYLGSVLFATFLPFGSALAQLSELGGTTGSGASTSAQFRAGVTADNGVSHKSVIGFDEVVDVVAEVQVESGHVNTTGNLYVVVVSGQTFFMGLESGAFEVWDQNPATLQPKRSATTLGSTVDLPIVENIAFGPAGVSDTSLQIFIAYDTTAAAGELYYSPTPLSFSIEAEQTQTQAQSLTLYQQSISGPIIQNLCRVCHQQGGQAAFFTDLLYEPATTQGILNNYNTLRSFILAGGGSVLLAKPSGGTSHVGGNLLPQGGNNFTNWSNFIDQVLQENP